MSKIQNSIENYEMTLNPVEFRKKLRPLKAFNNFSPMH